MSLIYSEGRENIFSKLYKEVERALKVDYYLIKYYSLILEIKIRTIKSLIKTGHNFKAFFIIFSLFSVFKTKYFII